MRKGFGSRQPILDPVDRLSEIIFGLIMALTFTGAISVSSEGREEIRLLLIGALGCNTAWGIVDAVMYLMTILIERGRALRNLRAIREAPDAATAQRILKDVMPSEVAELVEPAVYDQIRERIAGLKEPGHARLTGRDFQGALGIFLLVFLSTFPLVIPFILFSEPVHALRISNGVALLMLFLIGIALAKHAGWPRFRTAILMVAVGAILVVMTIALGG